jgi:tRNA (cytidine56-2'-O)-methyltransferase
MPKITVYRYGHRPARDKRITTHVALTARALGASAIIIDTPDRGIEENIRSVNRNFGSNFEVTTGISLESFLRNRRAGKPLIHLSMYGKPIHSIIGEIREYVKNTEEFFIIVGAEKVPGIVYSESDFNVSVTTQPISEVSALGIFLDHFYESKELENEISGRLKIIPLDKGKKIEYIPDLQDCIVLLKKYGATESLIEHSMAVYSVAQKISQNISCDRRIIESGSLLHDIGKTRMNNIFHGYEGFRICEMEQISVTVSQCVLKHVGAGITKSEAINLKLPDLDYMPLTIEEKIVACADNLILGSKRILKNEQLKRYQLKGLLNPMERMKSMFDEISKIAGIDLDRIET